MDQGLKLNRENFFYQLYRKSMIKFLNLFLVITASRLIYFQYPFCTRPVVGQALYSHLSNSE